MLDTGEGMGGERGEVVQLFNRALKEMRGGWVLPLTSLSTLIGTKEEGEDGEEDLQTEQFKVWDSQPSSTVKLPQQAPAFLP